MDETSAMKSSKAPRICTFPGSELSTTKRSQAREPAKKTLAPHNALDEIAS
jgi:hypothetical protein